MVLVNLATFRDNVESADAPLLNVFSTSVSYFFGPYTGLCYDHGCFENTYFIYTRTHTYVLLGADVAGYTALNRRFVKIAQKRPEPIGPGLIAGEDDDLGFKARSYGAILKLIFQGRYALPKGHVSQLTCRHKNSRVIQEKIK